jgi:hypothetical protein
MRRIFFSALFALLGLGLPVGAALFKVWVHQDAVQLGYQLSEYETQRKRLRDEAHQLEIELAAERSPANLLLLAKRLSLAPAAPQQVYAIAKGGSGGGSAHGRP